MRALGTAAVMSICGWAVLTSGASAAPPAAPQGVAMVANSADSVTLAWYRSSNDEAKSYQVYFSETKDGAFRQVTTVADRTATHGKLKPGTEYFYKVAAVNADGAGEPSKVATAFTITPTAGAPFPAKIARNMCVTLGAKIVSNPPAVAGQLTHLVDGLDATSCRLRKACEIKVQLKDAATIADAAYLMVHFRAQGGPAEWSNDPQARAPRSYVIIESLDSTNGSDGTWREIATGTNELLDGVIVIPNHRPKWLGLRSSGGEPVPASDKRPHPGDLLLSRFDVFRAAPAGQRNDYWTSPATASWCRTCPLAVERDAAPGSPTSCASSIPIVIPSSCMPRAAARC